MNLPFLGAIPIHLELRVNCDAGEPLRNWQVSDEIAEELDRVCKNLAAQISIATMGAVQTTLSIT